MSAGQTPNHARTVWKLLAVVAAMGSLGFASVPLYDLFCRVTGYGGTTSVAEQGSDVVLDQTILVRFDASLGGLGGCPHAPGASGNIVTDDLAFMLEAMGLRTGIDLDRLCAVAREVEQRGNDLAAENRRGGDPADGGVHGAEHRLRPRLSPHPRG